MYQRVLVAVDLGAASLDVANWVARQIRPDELVLAHVVRPIVPPAYIRGALVDPDALLQRDVAAAAERLHTLRDSLGVDATLDVRAGDPPAELEAAALEHECEVIVIGERGAHRSGPGLRGRTALAMMARAGLPVWFARTLEETPPRSVLAAVGAAAGGTEIIEAARAAQQTWGARAELLHVVDRLFVPRPDTEQISQRSVDDEVRREAETWLGEQRRRARVRGTDVALEIAIGDPASELLAAIHRGRHDLVILRGPTTGVMPDRVARALMAASPASLLRLPARDAPREAA